MLGFSLYPHHLKDGGDCTLRAFCEMIATAAERYGVDALGIGSDLVQDQPDAVVDWMRMGAWTKTVDYGEGDAANPGFPPPPAWFRGNRDLANIAGGLADVGFAKADVDALMGGNWLRFFRASFDAAAAT